jgi:outer membrane autotransporter protein
MNASDTVPGFDSQEGGFLAGFDRPLGGGFVAGVAAGYSHTDVSEHDGESGSFDTPRVALYGSYGTGPLTLAATVGYAHDFIDSSRPIVATGETATASHGGDEATGALEASWHLDADGVTLAPEAGLRYVHLAEDGFSETGSRGFDLTVASRDTDSLRPFVGATVARPFATDGGLTIVPSAELGYSRELLDATLHNTVAVGGGSFAVDGLALTRDQVEAGAAISARLDDRFALFASYRATLPTGNLLSQTVEAGLRVTF